MIENLEYWDPEFGGEYRYWINHTPIEAPSEHANHVESLWNDVKRNMQNAGECTDISFRSMTHASVIRYNFVREHGSATKVNVDLDSSTNSTSMTPAAAGGHPERHNGFDSLISAACAYDKSFLFRLGRCYKETASVDISKDMVRIMEIPGGPGIGDLDSRLESISALNRSESKDGVCWNMKVKSLTRLMNAREALGQPQVPGEQGEPVQSGIEETFVKICKNCGVIACTLQAVEEAMGSYVYIEDGCDMCQNKIPDYTGVEREKPYVVLGFFG